MIAGLLLAAAAWLPLSQLEQAPEIQLEVQILRQDSEAGSTRSAFLGESLRIQVEFELEEVFLQRQVQALWRMPLDLQLELRTPWLEAQPSLMASGKVSGGELQLVVDREIGSVREVSATTDGRRRFRLHRDMHVQQVGPIRLPPATLRLAYATGFEEDLVRGPVALDREELLLHSDPVELDVLPLPADAPRVFRGAVGDFAVDWRQVGSTEDAQLWRFAARGAGRLRPSHLPTMDRLEGWSLRGMVSEVLPDGLASTAELFPETPNSPAPAPTWSWFHPGSATYRTFPEDLAPRAAESGASAEDASSRDLLPFLWVALGMAAWAVFHQLRKRPKTAPPGKEAPAPAPSKPTDRLDECARLLGCRRADLYADDLTAALSTFSADDSARADLVDLLRRLRTARFTGGDSAAIEKELQERLQGRG